MTTDAAASARLASLRERIDEVDLRLLEAIGERLAICAEVAACKRAHDIPVMQQDRIEQVERRWSERGRAHGIDPACARRLCRSVVAEACRIEDDLLEGERPEPSVLDESAARIDHVAVAVRDLDTAIEHYRDMLGFRCVERRRIRGRGSGMDSAVMKAGGVTFVLVQGDSPRSNVSRYIEAYGPGVQHVAIEVEEPQRVLGDLRARGSALLTDVIHSPGLDQAFTKREPNSGIQLELVKRVANDGFSADNVRELFEAMEREDVC